MIEIKRRSFLLGISALFVAPALVRVENIMRINPLLVPQRNVLKQIMIHRGASYRWVAYDQGYELVDPMRGMRLSGFAAIGSAFSDIGSVELSSEPECIAVERDETGKLHFTDNIRMLDWVDMKTGKNFVELNGFLHAVETDSLPL